MARSPAPILVVPKPGVTVRLDGVVVPAAGIETTVDDEVENELLEGSLDCYPVPYHPPPISGSAAGALSGLMGAGAGAMRLAGTAAGLLMSGDGYSLGLDLTALQPPSTTVAPSFMRSGRWKFTFTQSARTSGVTYQLFNIGGATQNGLDLYYSNVHGNTCIYTWDSGASAGNGNLAFFEYSLGQAITVEVDTTIGRITISGATEGNGATDLGSAFVWPLGTMGIGRLSTSSGPTNFVGTFSNVLRYSTDAWLVGAATGTAGAISSISGTGAGVRPSLTGAATGGLRIAGTAAGAQAGLVGAAGGTSSAGAISGAGAGTQAGLTGAAAGGLRLAGTGAGAQSGLTGAASGAMRIAGTAAGAQSGLTGAASGAQRIAGTGAGAQAGLTGSAAGISDLSAAVSALAFSRVRADTRTEVSSKVSQLQDLVLSGHTFDQATAGLRPGAAATESTMNNRLVIPFTSGVYLTSSRTTAQWKFLHDGSDCELFFVLKVTTDGNFNEYLTTNVAATALGAGLTLYNDHTTGVINVEVDDASTAAVLVASASSNTTGTPRSVNLRMGSAQTPDSTLSVSSQADVTANYGLTPDTGNAALTLRIGSQNPCAMGVAELIICNRVLTSGERATVNSYISSYYAITI